MSKKKKKRKPLGLGRWIVLLICAIVFCGCGAYIGLYSKDKVSAEKDFEKLETIDFASIYGQNSDFVGWINVPDTKINYPVMQTPGDPEFYLHRNFEKEYSESGTPFVDAESRIFDDPTWNWLIYGHHMKFGTMFHDLILFQDQEFWQEHKTFTFTTYSPATGAIENEFEIVAASNSRIREKDSKEFKYYQYPGYTDEETFNQYVSGIKAESNYDTGITPVYGDQLVTLSTCAYHTEEGRFYIVGRKIN